MRHGLVLVEKDGRQRQIEPSSVRLYERRGWNVAADQPTNNAGRAPVVASKEKPKRKRAAKPAVHSEVHDVTEAE